MRWLSSHIHHLWFPVFTVLSIAQACLGFYNIRRRKAGLPPHEFSTPATVGIFAALALFFVLVTFADFR